MMQNTSMADQLREAMEKKAGGKNSFKMMGQYTSVVQQDEDREFVIYDAPNGEQIKVYGNWNEYAVSQDEEGNMMIADEDYPIIQNEQGEYVLDEATFEGQMKAIDAERQAQGGPGESRTGDLMEMLSQMRGADGSVPNMANGGKVHDGRRRLTVSTSRMGTDRGTMIQPTFYADGEPISPKQAAQLYSADYLKETESGGAGAPDFNRFVQNAIMRSLAAKGQAGGMRGAVREQQREFQEDRRKAGVQGLLRGLSQYR